MLEKIFFLNGHPGIADLLSFNAIVIQCYCHSLQRLSKLEVFLSRGYLGAHAYYDRRPWTITVDWLSLITNYFVKSQ